MKKPTPRRTRTFLRPQMPLSPHYCPGSFDVLCCRGKIALEHEGNHRFRELMLQSLPAYAASTCKLEKSKIVSIIVDTVRQRSPDGGFIKCFDDEWVEVGDKMAREKTGQMLRDLMNSQHPKPVNAAIQNKNKNKTEPFCSTPKASPAKQQSVVHSPSLVSVSSTEDQNVDFTMVGSESAGTLLATTTDHQSNYQPAFICLTEASDMNYRGVEEKHENLNIQDLWKILVKQQEQIDTLLASYIEPIPFNVVDDNDMASPSFPDLLEPLPVNEDLIDNFDVTKVFE